MEWICTAAREGRPLLEVIAVPGVGVKSEISPRFSDQLSVGTWHAWHTWREQHQTSWHHVFFFFFFKHEKHNPPNYKL